MDFVTFSIIIDDIVFPDGSVAMGVLGGGGTQTAFGMKLWADKVGLVGGIGIDLPPTALLWYKAAGIDTDGLHFSSDLPTARAWQYLEEDGRRKQVWRVPGSVVGQQLGRSLDRLPPNYQRAGAFHLGVHPEEPDIDFIKELRAGGAVVSIEPFRPASRPLTDGELRVLLSAAQIFSPNEEEARSLVGNGEPLELIQRLAEAGAEIIALRRGAAGSIIHRVDTGETEYIKAVSTKVVDPTGAGNAFCGGFLAGWVQTSDIGLSGRYGAVSASFLLEQVGLPEIRSDMTAVAWQRLGGLE